MLGVLLAIVAGIGALVPWVLLFTLFRAGVRRFRPRRLDRPRGIPLAQPGNPAAGLLIIVTGLAILAGWAWYTQPLWGQYVSHAWDYRVHGSGPANAISSQLMPLQQPLSSARTGYGYVSYSIGPAGESPQAWVTYHWRGIPAEPPADAPVEMITAPGPGGTYALNYRRDLNAVQLDPIREAFDRITTMEAPGRRAGVDLPILLRSVKAYWQGYFGYIDNPQGIARFAAGLPATVPMCIYGAVVGVLPSR